MAFIEETVVLKDIKLEEINKYYIQDNLTEIERINYILKKGYTCQKENLIKNISRIYFQSQSPQIIFNVITSIIDNIELWEKPLQLSFPYSLASIAISLPFDKSSNNNDTLRSSHLRFIILSFIKAISTLEKAISDEYINQFLRIIDYYEANDYKIPVIFPEVIDMATSLGKFGQSCTNRKFSAFLCTHLLRITTQLSNNERDLLKRIVFLCDDSERVIRFEMTYQLRYILHVKDKSCIVNNFKEILISYLSDGDIIFKTTLLESILKNLAKFDNVFIKTQLLPRISEMFDTSDFYTIENDFNCFKTTFVNILSAIKEDEQYRVIFIEEIRKFLRKFFINNQLKNSINVTMTFNVDYCIKYFHMICCVFNNSNSNNKSKDKDKDKDNNNKFMRELLQSLIRVIETNEENQVMFYNNLHLILMELNRDFATYELIQRVFFFIGTAPTLASSLIYGNSIVNGNTNIDDELQGDDSNTILNPSNAIISLLKFDIIIEIIIKTDNDDFINFFFNNFLHFKQITMNRNIDWRIQLAIFKGLKLLPHYLMMNYFKYKSYEEMIAKMLSYAKDFLAKQGNLLLEMEIVRFLPYCIHYSTMRDDVMRFVNEEIVGNANFYRRRLTIAFYMSCYEIMSIERITTLGIITKINDMLINDNNVMKCNMLLMFIKKLEMGSNSIIIDKTINDAIDTINISKSVGDFYLKEIIHKYKKLIAKPTHITTITSAVEKEKIALEAKISEIETVLLEEMKKEDLISSIKKCKTNKVKPLTQSLNIKRKDSCSSSTKNICKFDDSKVITNSIPLLQIPQTPNAGNISSNIGRKSSIKITSSSSLCSHGSSQADNSPSGNRSSNNNNNDKKTGSNTKTKPTTTKFYDSANKNSGSNHKK